MVQWHNNILNGSQWLQHVSHMVQQDFIENEGRNDSDLAATQVSVTIPKNNDI